LLSRSSSENLIISVLSLYILALATSCSPIHWIDATFV
jgi:hypothetical protein